MTHFLTSRLSHGAGLLSLSLIAFGLSIAPAKQATAQACQHLGNQVACPIGEAPDSNSLGFDANGNAFYANGTLVPGDYNVQPSNTETGQGLFNLGNELGGPNQLWGDWFLVDPANGYAQGDNLVRIESDPDLGAGEGYTFYGRYSRQDVDPNLRPPSVHEVLLGASHQLTRDTLLGTSDGRGAVRSYGYGRFGTAFGDLETSDPGSTTNLTSRLRLQIDMTTETDGGVPFGTRYRIRNDATHIVAAGDTLFRLALRYGVSLNSIAAENNLPSTGIIFVGQELVIPGRGEEVRRNQGGTEASNESEIQTAYRQEALEYLFDESWGDHDIKFGAELPDADKEKLVQQTLDNALHLFSNADCSTTNSCGTDVFTPSPVTFGDCGVGGCATTVPIEFLSGCDEGSCQVAVPGFEETTDGGVVAVPSAPRVTGEAVATKQLLVKGKAYDTVIIKTKDGTHYATRPSDGHVFGQVKESKSRPGFWNPKGGEFKSPPPLQHVTAEVFAFLHAGDPGTHKYYQFRPSEVGGCDVSNSCSADSAILETDIESVLPFLDGFESGDTTAWSSTVP